MASLDRTPIYKNHSAVFEELNPRWPEMARTVTMDVARKECQKIFKAYENAFKGELDFMLLGGPELRERAELAHSFGTLSTEPLGFEKSTRTFLQAHGAPAKGLKQTAKKHLQFGAIVNSQGWHILLNDGFMLGAIHAGKDFHFCYEGLEATEDGLPADDLLWDAEKGRPRALGREVLMLALSGYEPIIAEIDGTKQILFKAPDVRVPIGFIEVWDKVRAFDLEGIKTYLRGGVLSPFSSHLSPYGGAMSATSLASAGAGGDCS